MRRQPRIHHTLECPSTGIPSDPPVSHPRTFPVKVCANNAAFQWALLRRPGSLPPIDAEKLLASFQSAITRKVIEHADEDISRLRSVAKAVTDNDITVVTGAHGSGKTSLIPFLAKSSSEAESSERAAKSSSEAESSERAAKSSSEAESSKGVGKTSEKFIVCTDANNGATLKIHYKRVYPSLNTNLFLDNAASTIGDQLIPGNMSRDERNISLEPVTVTVRGGEKKATGIMSIPGIICSQHLCIELMKFGIIGTVFVENGECFHHHSAFTAVISKAIAKMLVPEESRRIGRLVIITADDADSRIVKDFIDKLASAAQGKLKIGVASLKGGYPMRPATTLLFPGEFKRLAKEGFADADFIWDLRELVPAMEERKLVMTPYDLNTAMRLKDSDEPDHHFLRKVVEVVSDHVLKAEISWAKNEAPLKRLGTILITVASREAVQAIANGLLHKNAFYLHKNGAKTPAFNTSRMSFEWKFDVGCFREAEVYITGDFYLSANNQRMVKGRVIIAVPAVAEALDVGPLHAAILCANRQTPSTYKSCGLRAPRSHFVDSHAIKQIRSRLGRSAREEFSRFYFSGTAQLCDELLGRADERMSIYDNTVTMGDFIQEYAPHDMSDHVVPIRHHPKGHIMLDDARRMGLIETDNTTTRSTATAEVDAMLRMFPKIHPQTAAIAVMGTRCGVAAHAIIAAAIEQADDRIYQQAATNLRGDNHACYELPLADLFKATIPFVPHGGGMMVHPPSYESERMAMIDLCASWVDAVSFRCSDPDKLFVDFVRGAINPPNSNWWSGVWSGGVWQRMAGTHPALANRVNVPQTFTELYQRFFKDEGREAFCQALREITKALHEMGLTPDEEDVIGGNNRAAYNRHLLCSGSPLLSPRGAKILSGIITMCSSNVGEHIGLRTIPNSTQDNQPAVLPPKYKVFDGVTWAGEDDTTGVDNFIHVSGFSVPPKPTPADRNPKPMPHPNRRLAVFTRSTASPDPGRFHSLIHPISVGQMAVLLNVFGKWKSQAVKVDGDNTEEKKTFVLLQLSLTGSHARNNIVNIKMEHELWLSVKKARDYLHLALNWALTGQNMDDYEKFIERTWDECTSKKPSSTLIIGGDNIEVDELKTTSLSSAVKEWLRSNESVIARQDTPSLGRIWSQFESSSRASADDKREHAKLAAAATDKDFVFLVGDRGDSAFATGVMAAKFGAANSDSANFKKVDRFVVIVENKESAIETKKLLAEVFPGTIISVYIPGVLDYIYCNANNELGAIHPESDGLIVLSETASEMIQYDMGGVGSYIIEATGRHKTTDNVFFLNFAVEVMERRTTLKSRGHPDWVRRRAGRVIVMSGPSSYNIKKLRSVEEQLSHKDIRVSITVFKPIGGKFATDGDRYYSEDEEDKQYPDYHAPWYQQDDEFYFGKLFVNGHRLRLKQRPLTDMPRARSPDRWSPARPSQPVLRSLLDVPERRPPQEDFSPEKPTPLPPIRNGQINSSVKLWLDNNDYSTLGDGCATPYNIWDQFEDSDLTHHMDKLDGMKNKIIQAVRNKDITIFTGERGDAALATGVMAAKFGAAYSKSANFKKVDRFVVIVDSKESAIATRRRLLDIFPRTIISVFVPGLIENVYCTKDNELIPFHPDTDGLIVLPETALEMIRYDKGVVGSYIIEASDRHTDDESITNFLHTVVQEMTADDHRPANRHLGRLIIMTKREKSRAEQWKDQKMRLDTIRGLKVAHTILDYGMTIDDAIEDDNRRPSTNKSPSPKRRREGHCLMVGPPRYRRDSWWLLFDKHGAVEYNYYEESSPSRSPSQHRNGTETSDVSTAREPEEDDGESDDDIQFVE